MTLEDDAMRIHETDQAAAKAADEARLFAAFYLSLVGQGVPDDKAETFTCAFIASFYDVFAYADDDEDEG